MISLMLWLCIPLCLAIFVYGVVYKKLAGLLEKAQVGKTYQANDIVVIEDPNHQEINGEGKLVFVQFNKEFTYNGEPVSDFVTKGRLEWTV